MLVRAFGTKKKRVAEPATLFQNSEPTGLDSHARNSRTCQPLLLDLFRAVPAKHVAVQEMTVERSSYTGRIDGFSLSREGGNPRRSVVKYKRRKRELGRVLGALEAEGRVPAHAAAALRLLMLTGCRLNEILTLRWDDVDRSHVVSASSSFPSTRSPPHGACVPIRHEACPVEEWMWHMAGR